MVRTGTFTHADFHRIFAHHRQNLIRHQSIVKHRIRSLYRLQSMYGQQARIARPCTHQNHFASKRRFPIQLRYQFAFCRLDIVLSRKNTETAVEQLFPKITASFDMMNRLFNLFAPFTCNTRHRARMQRNQCFNNLPPFPCQYRRSPSAGYGYLQRPPIHHGRHNKRTQIRRIHRIAQFRPSFRHFKNTAVKHAIIRRRNNEIHLVQHGFFKQAAQPNYFPFSHPLLKLRIQSFRNNAYARSGRQQAFRLAFGNLTRTCQ